MEAIIDARKRSVQQSAFLLPSLANDIPVVLSDASDSERALARFALASEKAGIPLPATVCKNPGAVLAQQWAEYYATLCTSDNHHVIVARPGFRVTGKDFQINIGADGNLNVVYLKPLVERLESAAPGSGWYVADLINNASVHAMHCYGPAFLADRAAYQFCDCRDDQEYAAHLLEETGGKEYPKGKIPASVLKKLRKENGEFPSEFARAVGGHKHLLGWGKAPPELARWKPSALQSLVNDERLEEFDRMCIAHAIELGKAFKARTAAAFQWYAEDHSQSEWDDDEDIDPYYEGPELIGAACFVVWDKLEAFQDAASHFERHAYEGSNAIEALGCSSISIHASDEQYQQLARNLRDYLDMWSKFDRLLSCFPINEEDDHEI